MRQSGASAHAANRVNAGRGVFVPRGGSTGGFGGGNPARGRGDGAGGRAAATQEQVVASAATNSSALIHVQCVKFATKEDTLPTMFLMKDMLLLLPMPMVLIPLGI